MRPNPYAMQDADREWVERKQETDDALADYHRDLIADEMPVSCDSRCGYRNPWGFCRQHETFPDCSLMNTK